MSKRFKPVKPFNQGQACVKMNDGEVGEWTGEEAEMGKDCVIGLKARL